MYPFIMKRQPRLAILWLLFIGMLAAIVLAPGGWTQFDGRHLGLAVTGLILAANLAASDYDPKP